MPVGPDIDTPDTDSPAVETPGVDSPAGADAVLRALADPHRRDIMRLVRSPKCRPGRSRATSP